MTSGVKKVKTLKQARIELKLTQQQLAEVLAISSSTVHRLEVERMKPSIGLHEKINKLFGVPILIPRRSMKSGKQDAEDADIEKMIMTEGERRFLKTCWNMRDTLRDERMIVRDLVDATYEFMESCEAITYLYKWSKIGFYHYSSGGVVDQGFFKWDMLPPKYRRLLQN